MVDLQRKLGKDLPTNLGVTRASQPTFYHHEGANPSQLDVLVCSDSCYVSQPNTCPEVALQHPGESYDTYYPDQADSEEAIDRGSGDLVSIDNACLSYADSLFTVLGNFLSGGGQAFVNTYNMDPYAYDPCWANAGVAVSAHALFPGSCPGAGD